LLTDLVNLLVQIKGAKMANEQKEGRINIEDLPRSEKELTPEEGAAVQGGLDGQGRLFIGNDLGVYRSGGGQVKVIDGTHLAPVGPDGSVK
jgi:hypothetical protein